MFAFIEYDRYNTSGGPDEDAIKNILKHDMRIFSGEKGQSVRKGVIASSSEPSLNPESYYNLALEYTRQKYANQPKGKLNPVKVDLYELMHNSKEKYGTGVMLNNQGHFPVVDLLHLFVSNMNANPDFTFLGSSLRNEFHDVEPRYRFNPLSFQPYWEYQPAVAQGTAFIKQHANIDLEPVGLTLNNHSAVEIALVQRLTHFQIHRLDENLDKGYFFHLENWFAKMVKNAGGEAAHKKGVRGEMTVMNRWMESADGKAVIDPQALEQATIYLDNIGGVATEKIIEEQILNAPKKMNYAQLLTGRKDAKPAELTSGLIQKALKQLDEAPGSRSLDSLSSEDRLAVKALAEGELDYAKLSTEDKQLTTADRNKAASADEASLDMLRFQHRLRFTDGSEETIIPSGAATFFMRGEGRTTGTKPMSIPAILKKNPNAQVLVRVNPAYNLIGVMRKNIPVFDNAYMLAYAAYVAYPIAAASNVLRDNFPENMPLPFDKSANFQGIEVETKRTNISAKRLAYAMADFYYNGKLLDDLIAQNHSEEHLGDAMTRLKRAIEGDLENVSNEQMQGYVKEANGSLAEFFTLAHQNWRGVKDKYGGRAFSYQGEELLNLEIKPQDLRLNLIGLEDMPIGKGDKGRVWNKAFWNLVGANAAYTNDIDGVQSELAEQMLYFQRDKGTHVRQPLMLSGVQSTIDPDEAGNILQDAEARLGIRPRTLRDPRGQTGLMFSVAKMFYPFMARTMQQAPASFGLPYEKFALLTKAIRYFSIRSDDKNKATLGTYSSGDMEIDVDIRHQSSFWHEMVHGVDYMRQLGRKNIAGWREKDSGNLKLTNILPKTDLERIDGWLARRQHASTDDNLELKVFMESLYRYATIMPFRPSENTTSDQMREQLMITDEDMNAALETASSEAKGAAYDSPEFLNAAQKAMNSLVYQRMPLVSVSPMFFDNLTFDDWGKKGRGNKSSDELRELLDGELMEGMAKVDTTSKNRPVKFPEMIMWMDEKKRIRMRDKYLEFIGLMQNAQTYQGFYWSNKLEVDARLLEMIGSKRVEELTGEIGWYKRPDIIQDPSNYAKKIQYQYPSENVDRAKELFERFFTAVKYRDNSTEFVDKFPTSDLRFNYTPDKVLYRMVEDAMKNRDGAVKLPPFNPADSLAIPAKSAQIPQVKMIFSAGQALLKYENFRALMSEKLGRVVQTAMVGFHDVGFSPDAIYKAYIDGRLDKDIFGEPMDKGEVEGFINSMISAAGISGEKTHALMGRLERNKYDYLDFSDAYNTTEIETTDYDLGNLERPVDQVAKSEVKNYAPSNPEFIKWGKKNGKDRIIPKPTAPIITWLDFQAKKHDPQSNTGVMTPQQIADAHGFKMDELYDLMFPFGHEDERALNSLQVEAFLRAVTNANYKLPVTDTMQMAYHYLQAITPSNTDEDATAAKLDRIESMNLGKFRMGMLNALGTGTGKTRLIAASHRFWSAVARRKADTMLDKALKEDADIQKLAKGKSLKARNRAHAGLWRKSSEYRKVVSKGQSIAVTGGATIAELLEIGMLNEWKALDMAKEKSPEFIAETFRKMMRNNEGILEGKDGHRWMSFKEIKERILRSADFIHENDSLPDDLIPRPGDMLFINTYEMLLPGESISLKEFKEDIRPLHANDPVGRAEASEMNDAMLRLLSRHPQNLRMVFAMMGMPSVKANIVGPNGKRSISKEFKDSIDPTTYWEPKNWTWWEGNWFLDEVDVMANVGDQENLGLKGLAIRKKQPSTRATYIREIIRMFPVAQISSNTATPTKDLEMFSAYERMLHAYLSDDFRTLTKVIDVIRQNPYLSPLTSEVIDVMVQDNRAISFGLYFPADAIKRPQAIENLKEYDKQHEFLYTTLQGARQDLLESQEGAIPINQPRSHRGGISAIHEKDMTRLQVKHEKILAPDKRSIYEGDKMVLQRLEAEYAVKMRQLLYHIDAIDLNEYVNQRKLFVIETLFEADMKRALNEKIFHGHMKIVRDADGKVAKFVGTDDEAKISVQDVIGPRARHFIDTQFQHQLGVVPERRARVGRPRFKVIKRPVKMNVYAYWQYKREQMEVLKPMPQIRRRETRPSSHDEQFYPEFIDQYLQSTELENMTLLLHRGDKGGYTMRVPIVKADGSMPGLLPGSTDKLPRLRAIPKSATEVINLTDEQLAEMLNVDSIDDLVFTAPDDVSEPGGVEIRIKGQARSGTIPETDPESADKQKKGIDSAENLVGRVERMVRDFKDDHLLPIDHLRSKLHELGVATAEINGRKVVMDEVNGNWEVRLRNSAKANREAEMAFNKVPKNKKEIATNMAIILNTAAARGVNLTRTRELQLAVTMLFLDAPVQSDKLMQLMGRILRTNTLKDSATWVLFESLLASVQIRQININAKLNRLVATSMGGEGSPMMATDDMPDFTPASSAEKQGFLDEAIFRSFKRWSDKKILERASSREEIYENLMAWTVVSELTGNATIEGRLAKITNWETFLKKAAPDFRTKVLASPTMFHRNFRSDINNELLRDIIERYRRIYAEQTREFGVQSKAIPQGGIAESSIPLKANDNGNPGEEMVLLNLIPSDLVVPFDRVFTPHQNPGEAGKRYQARVQKYQDDLSFYRSYTPEKVVGTDTHEFRFIVVNNNRKQVKQAKTTFLEPTILKGVHNVTIVSPDPKDPFAEGSRVVMSTSGMVETEKISKLINETTRHGKSLPLEEGKKTWNELIPYLRKAGATKNIIAFKGNPVQRLKVMNQGIMPALRYIEFKAVPSVRDRLGIPPDKPARAWVIDPSRLSSDISKQKVLKMFEEVMRFGIRLRKYNKHIWHSRGENISAEDIADYMVDNDEGGDPPKLYTMGSSGIAEILMHNYGTDQNRNIKFRLDYEDAVGDFHRKIGSESERLRDPDIAMDEYVLLNYIMSNPNIKYDDKLFLAHTMYGFSLKDMDKVAEHAAARAKNRKK